MPQFYFNLHNDVDVIDHEGVELSDLDAAREEAFRPAAEFIGEVIANRRAINPYTVSTCWTSNAELCSPRPGGV